MKTNNSANIYNKSLSSLSTQQTQPPRPKCLLEDPTIDHNTKCVLKRFLMPSGDVVEIVIYRRKPQYISDRTTSDASNMSFIDKLEQELKLIAPQITTRKKVVLVDPTSTQNDENLSPKKFDPAIKSPPKVPQSIIKKTSSFKADQSLSEISFNDSVLSKTSKRSIEFDQLPNAIKSSSTKRSPTKNNRKNEVSNTTPPRIMPSRISPSTEMVQTNQPVSRNFQTQSLTQLQSEPIVQSQTSLTDLTQPNQPILSKKKCKLVNRPRFPLIEQERPPSPIFRHSIVAVAPRSALKSSSSTK